MTGNFGITGAFPCLDALVVIITALSGAAWAPQPVVVREWPCRIIVERPLLQLVDRAWKGSETFRRQCVALAERRAIAVLEPGEGRSGFTARTRIGLAEDGTVIGRVFVTLNTETLERIAHELEHILERAEGMDPAVEARRTAARVWQTLEGFETQRAIDNGRQVMREVRDGAQPSRIPVTPVTPVPLVSSRPAAARSAR